MEELLKCTTVTSNTKATVIPEHGNQFFAPVQKVSIFAVVQKAVLYSQSMSFLPCFFSERSLEWSEILIF
jgi:hypothetical protein